MGEIGKKFGCKHTSSQQEKLLNSHTDHKLEQIPQQFLIIRPEVLSWAFS